MKLMPFKRGGPVGIGPTRKPRRQASIYLMAVALVLASLTGSTLLGTPAYADPFPTPDISGKTHQTGVFQPAPPRANGFSCKGTTLKYEPAGKWQGYTHSNCQLNGVPAVVKVVSRTTVWKKVGTSAWTEVGSSQTQTNNGAASANSIVVVPNSGGCYAAVGFSSFDYNGQHFEGISATHIPTGDCGGTPPPPPGVYFVHGADAIPFVPAYDCDGWNPMTFKLRQLGWTGPMHEVAYYADDTNCNTRTGFAIASDPIDVMAKGLSKHIYDNYTNKGQYVNVIAHSMGGLIIRRAIDGAQKREAGFSPPINIKYVLTLSTPHQGTSIASACAAYNGGCEDMAPTSTFMSYLRDNAWSPEGTTGTTWWAVGSDEDAIVNRLSAVFMGAEHKLVYNTYYTHLNIYNDTTLTPYLPTDYLLFTRPTGQWTHATETARVIDLALAIATG